ncbi:MAG: DUF6766 family protein [Candidatus Obscuribacterales bacterium]
MSSATPYRHPKALHMRHGVGGPNRRSATIRGFLKDNALSLLMVTLFLMFWGAQSYTGYLVYEDDSARTRQPHLSYIQYLRSAHFWEATAENWESEFFQMGSLVVLTVFFKQKGSIESDDDDEKTSSKKKRTKSSHIRSKLLRILYENSLGIALLSLFAGCFAGHAASSYAEHSQELAALGQHVPTFMEFMRSPELWFESTQNWQSEFLAVASLTILSIFLRQKNSAESKTVD